MVLWLLAVLQVAAALRAPAQRVVVLGGSGRIGTACAIHLLTRRPELEIVLVGRDEARGRRAVAEVAGEAGGARCDFVALDYRDVAAAGAAFDGAAAVVHVAGPFDGDGALAPLAATIGAGVPVYVDVSDPIAYIEGARGLARGATAALLCAGAFPGLSNVLAVEAAALLPAPIRDLNFSYFTAGLGGSGAVNLDITNYGFGGSTPRFVDGAPADSEDFAGTDQGTARFAVSGEREVWAWPFPEARTVAAALGVRGTSRAAMGTAPAAWNGMLRLLVALVPRSWWLSERFSGGMARFSEPLVRVTDAFVGEDHAMRIDVTDVDGGAAVALQSHASFRRCVGQSVAEFALDLLAEPPAPGVYLPEELYADAARRETVLAALTATPGTTAFSVLKTGAPA